MNIVQQHIIDILHILVPILNKMDIKFMMLGGTMLGAVRHKGFIPWDDDVDIGMFRDDYEFFLKNIEQYLPNDFELNTYYGVHKHHYYFARIVDKRYKVLRCGSSESRDENVWVDIFPLDGMPNNFFSLQKHKLKLSFSRLMYHLSCIEKVNYKRPGRLFIEKIVIKLALVFKSLIRLNTLYWLNRIDELLKLYSPLSSMLIVSFMGQVSFKFNEIFEKKIYSELSQFQFEDMVLPGIANYDFYLKQIYGNYMIPPSDANKNAHCSTLIDKS